MLTLRSLLLLLFLSTSVLFAQTQAASSTVLRCGAVYDGKSDQLRRNVTIVVTNGKIASVGESSQSAAAEVVDLSALTCLPGLIDTHTHVLLQGDITSAHYDEQLLKQSVPYRTILATQSARSALDAGFTTIRDLETEGAGYADVAVRDAIAHGVIPGPRMQVATRALD